MSDDTDKLRFEWFKSNANLDLWECKNVNDFQEWNGFKTYIIKEISCIDSSNYEKVFSDASLKYKEALDIFEKAKKEFPEVSIKMVEYYESGSLIVNIEGLCTNPS